MGSGKASEEEKDEAKVRKGERQVVDQVDTVEGGVPGARRRWRLAKNMLVAFKVEREEEDNFGRKRRQERAGGRRLSFLGQQYPNMDHLLHTREGSPTQEKHHSSGCLSHNEEDEGGEEEEEGKKGEDE